ncbi:hypothetical protein A4U53_001980 (plasmid) [Rhizobium ruizarguesonis]|uniref:Uncharacterized protein n=1 Tax=Rhizobium ruizarguesonis TaxID=2081791 RepID=A0ACD5EGF4_9HYPH|nr:hypothetical protein [Rhizobium leguminosarum]
MVPIGRNNFELNTSIALRDVYRLFLVFAGDERLFDLSGDDQEDPLRLMRNDLFVDEITHLLIGTAIANRIQLEWCCHVKFLWLERSAARGYSGDTGRNFPCIESFEPMVANCLRGDGTELN